MRLSAEEIKLLDRVAGWLKNSKGSVLNPLAATYDPKKAAEFRQCNEILRRALSEPEVIPNEADSMWAGL